MRILLLMALALSAWPAESRVVTVGEFANWRFTEEHQYGYGLQLWRQGERLFGFFLASSGPQGDTPIGVIDNVRWDRKTGRLAFHAKLSTGVVMEGGKERNARDLYEFEGSLRASVVKGELKHSEAGGPVVGERIVLRKTTGESLTQPVSFEEWRKGSEEILRLRGPKW